MINRSKPGKTGSNGFLKTRYLKDLDRIDGKLMEFEWKIFPGFTPLGILDEIQKMMTESKCEPEQFKGKIIFLSMYNDIDWGKRENQQNCIANSVKNYRVCSKISARTLVISGVDPRRNGTEPTLINQTENGTGLLRA